MWADQERNPKAEGSADEGELVDAETLEEEESEQELDLVSSLYST